MGSLAWLFGASTFIQMWGAYEQGKAARAAAEFAALQAERLAGTEIALSQRRAAEETRQAKLVASRALAVAASSGAGVSDPTMVKILADTEGVGAYRASVALYEGESRARQLRLEAAGMRVEGADRRYGYALSAMGASARGGSTLYAGSLYGKYGGGGPSGDSALLDAGTPDFSSIG